MDDIRAELEREEELDLVDPLRHFLTIDNHQDNISSSDQTSNFTRSFDDIRDAPSKNDYTIVPHQLESIINQHTTIRYYRDLSRKPQLIDQPSSSSSSSSNHFSQRQEEYWDINLKLDMTTGCGGKIWPAAEVLGAYIAARYSSPSTASSQEDGKLMETNSDYPHHKFDWRNKTIIELGSGTGLVGYLVHALCLENCKIWVTDQSAMLPLMRQNLSLNFSPSSSSQACSISSSNSTSDDIIKKDGSTSFVRVAELDWSQPIPLEFTRFGLPDVLLLADCVYLESAFQNLIDTMVGLSCSRTEILFCYQKRRKADRRFFILLKKYFDFQIVKDDDQVRMKEYTRQGTQLLRIWKKGKHLVT
ncbi:uncharacterized protein MEPE_03392 [Melanopsichium pennsylvanicum]|uniref:Protein-lysine N-methyltransferase EFM6 n=1 Tax=Melanopsichium pennsylvanicum TaxID=63383 RepID=A0AAJ4XPA9_9BASI|nr:uncharacterized protein MEPE_03392 [Melanopsichium pennsylvanicum]